MQTTGSDQPQPAADPIGLKVYEEVFGKPAGASLLGLRQFTINHLFARIWSRSSEAVEKEPAITLRERSMITIALLAAAGRAEELKAHLEAAKHLGISREQALEIMIHVAHYGGWPAGHAGQERVLEVFDAEAELTYLNQTMTEAEKKGDVPFFREILADDLIFRRAKGTVVTKEQFILDLKSDAFEKLEANVLEVRNYADGAVAKVMVTSKRRGEPSEGKYLNVRRFARRDGAWRLVAWLNTEVP